MVVICLHKEGSIGDGFCSEYSKTKDDERYDF
jgi:hypothetical protein